jgi:hypothetical protein
MEAAPVFASNAINSGLPPVPGTEQARAIAYGHASLAGTTEAVKEASAWVYPLRREIGASSSARNISSTGCSSP